MVDTHVVLAAALSISVLVFSAKILGSVVARVGVPSVLGELAAGVVLGPHALGALLVFSGHGLVEINDTVEVFAEIGAILILFTAGLEMTFTEFRGAGAKSFVIGTMGVVVPFFGGYYVTLALGYDFASALLVGAALTATSIAITIKVLEELRKTGDPDARLMINAAVVDDVLGLTILSVVVSTITAGEPPTAIDLASKFATILGLWLALLVSIVFFVPRLLRYLPSWRIHGTDEAAATVICFGCASIATLLGLSPIVGAYAAGMGLAGSHALRTIKDYVEKVNMIFAPLFFAVIGASLDLTSISSSMLVFLAVIVVVAIAGKLAGCGLTAAAMNRSLVSGWRIGVGMTARGEVGLIIAGIGLTSGVIGEEVYGVLVGAIVLTTVASPILLKSSYRERVSARP